jgi:hypothetical protein
VDQPKLKSTEQTRALMRQKAQAAGNHPDTNVAALGDFIDILISDVEILLREREQSAGVISRRKLEIAYDEETDVVTIDGVKYDGRIFRWFGGKSPRAFMPGHLFMFIDRGLDSVTIRRVKFLDDLNIEDMKIGGGPKC